jgi:hypothetical protein
MLQHVGTDCHGIAPKKNQKCGFNYAGHLHYLPNGWFFGFGCFRPYQSVWRFNACLPCHNFYETNLGRQIKIIPAKSGY